MNETIVMHALQELILSVNYASENTRTEALTELIRIVREQERTISRGDKAIQWNASMAEFRNHRASNSGGRIGTIKLVRERIGCGLSEALIIVKGIETQDGIV